MYRFYRDSAGRRLRSLLPLSIALIALAWGCSEDAQGPGSGVVDAGVVDQIDDSLKEFDGTHGADGEGADSGLDADAASDAVTDPGSDTDADADTDAVTDTATDTVTDAATDTGTVTDAVTDSASDAVTDAASDTAAVPHLGCSDNSREGFVDLEKYPMLAACQGAWTLKGIHHGVPACGRQGGNDGTNAVGNGCNVEDLCAEGWHVCFGAKDVLERNPHGCTEIALGAPAGPKFFLARTSSTGAFNCSQDSTKFGAPGTSNDLFGCGNLGCPLDLKTYPSCNPLNIASHDVCKGLRNDKGCGSWCAHLGKFAGEPNTWDCGSSTTLEANNVIKSDPTRQGGVLCCSNTLFVLP